MDWSWWTSNSSLNPLNHGCKWVRVWTSAKIRFNIILGWKSAPFYLLFRLQTITNNEMYWLITNMTLFSIYAAWITCASVTSSDMYVLSPKDDDCSADWYRTQNNTSQPIFSCLRGKVRNALNLYYDATISLFISRPESPTITVTTSVWTYMWIWWRANSFVFELLVSRSAR